MNSQQTLPLDDIRVVELGQLLAGPFCGQLLGDFGADVIKVEDPGIGDPMRQWGREKPYGKSLWWPVVARNKKSVTANLRTPEGQDLVRRLVAKADVLIENFRPGTLERWGMSPETLWEINPRLVVTRVTGFGQSGPYAARAGYGSIGEAMGGIRYVTGDPDRPPARAGISLGDSLAATFACLGTLVALHQRGRTGRGQVVDSAIYEAVLAMMESLVPEYQLTGYQRERTGTTLPNVVAEQRVPDCRRRDDPDRSQSGHRFPPSGTGDEPARAGNATSATPRTARAGRTWASSTNSSPGGAQPKRPTRCWNDCTKTAYRPAASSRPRTCSKTRTSPPARPSYGSATRDLGEFAMQNVVPKLSESPGRVRHVGPGLGEHNEEIYRGLLGLDDDSLSALRSTGII